NGEKIKFKLINSANGRAYDVTGSFNFQADSLKTAFDLKALSIKLTSPNGGETWNPQGSYDITWRSGGIDNIRIELYKGTVLKTVICASAPAGIGKYTWTIPANIPQGTKYKIKISSVDVGLNLSDISNDYFTIAGSSGTDGSL
ncbi:MAG: trimeric autotransporter adhesin, partial [Acidobacteriota bacterium]|nr:trimeric autotransporter adhesin [Acidobacteriota bacterium]